MADLEELYREIILDHYRSPRNRGELASPPAHRVEGFNPLCGDEIVISLDGRGRHADRPQDRRLGLLHQPVVGLADVGRREGQADRRGAPAHRHLQGDDVDPRGRSTTTVTPTPTAPDRGEPEEIDLEKLGELAALQGVVKFPVRIKCATLSWNALAQGLDEVAAEALLTLVVVPTRSSSSVLAWSSRTGGRISRTGETTRRGTRFPRCGHDPVRRDVRCPPGSHPTAEAPVPGRPPPPARAR